jgi:DNA-binding PadR family transcriptional regulator
MPSGTVYPALRRLEENGQVKGQWEKHTQAVTEGRPPRRYYELTRAGRTLLAEAIGRYRLLEQSSLATQHPKAAE